MAHSHSHSHSHSGGPGGLGGHSAQPGSSNGGSGWLLAALGVITVFMVAEVIAGLFAHSLALLADAAHMLTDAAALLLAVVAIRIARRPARGAYTYGFTRVDALSGQINGITLILLAIWFAVEGIGRLVTPAASHGGVMVLVAGVGAVVNMLATALAARADRSSLNVRGVLAHLLSDVWAFAATFAAGLVIVATGWHRADGLAALLVAALMVWTGSGLVREAGRVFLEASPADIDPHALGLELVSLDGVAQIHDLHVWVLGSNATALSAHVLVERSYDCHDVAERLRAQLAERHRIRHVTLQADHVDSDRIRHDADNCADAHGVVHVAPAQS